MVFIRKVELRMKEQKKYEVIKKLKETNGNKKRAAVELGCTVRHVNRMLKGYETQGKEFFSHGNKGRRPASALSEELKESILLLYQNKYYDSNLTHFTEKLAENEDIRVSEGTVRNLLYSHDILSPCMETDSQETQRQAKNPKGYCNIKDRKRKPSDCNR